MFEKFDIPTIPPYVQSYIDYSDYGECIEKSAYCYGTPDGETTTDIYNLTFYDKNLPAFVFVCFTYQTGDSVFDPLIEVTTYVKGIDFAIKNTLKNCEILKHERLSFNRELFERYMNKIKKMEVA